MSSPFPSLFRPLLPSNWLGWGPPFARAVRVARGGPLAADPGRFSRAPPPCLPLLRLARGVQFHSSWDFLWSPLFSSSSWRVLRTQIKCTTWCRSCSGIGPRGGPPLDAAEFSCGAGDQRVSIPVHCFIWPAVSRPPVPLLLLCLPGPPFPLLCCLLARSLSCLSPCCSLLLPFLPAACFLLPASAVAVHAFALSLFTLAL